jgi:hypothetical protein
MMLNTAASNEFDLTSLNKFFICNCPINDLLDKQLSVDVAMATRPITACPRNHALHRIENGSVPCILTEIGLQWSISRSCCLLEHFVSLEFRIPSQRLPSVTAVAVHFDHFRLCLFICLIVCFAGAAHFSSAFLTTLGRPRRQRVKGSRGVTFNMKSRCPDVAEQAHYTI